MKYRYKLGQTLGDSIVKDGDFHAAALNWTLAAGWSVPIGGGQADHAGSPADVISQNCGFVAGVRYKITFEIFDMTFGGGEFLQVYLSGFSITNNPENNYYKLINGIYEVYGTCLSSTDATIKFIAYGTVSIRGVKAEPYEWNTELSYEPDGWKDSKISLKSSELLDGLYVKYIEGLTFIRDGYDYILAAYADLVSVAPKLFCETIPILIQRYIPLTDTWETHFEGLIYLSDCKFDFKRKQVSCNIEDVVFSKALRMAKDKIIGTAYHNINVIDAANAYVYPAVTCQVANAANIRSARNVYLMFRVLRNIIHEITDLGVTISSDLLLTTPYNGAANPFYLLGITPFQNFANTTPSFPCFASLGELLNDLNVTINIGVVSDYASDIPKLLVESKAFLQGDTTTFTVDNNEGLFGFYSENNYQKVLIGYERPTLDDVTNIDAASFIQMKDWTEQEYNAKIQCSDKTLTALSKTGAHPQWIYNQLAAAYYDTSTATGLKALFVPRNFFLQMEYVAPNYNSKSVLYATTGEYLNNMDITVDDIMQRNVDVSLNSSYLAADTGNNIYDALESEISKTNDPIIRVWEFETPITLADLDEIVANPYYMIQMTSEYFTGVLTGYILEFAYSNNSQYEGGSMATFKIIST